MSDVLDVCMMGAIKTRIVYSANLNFTRLNRYLRVLLSLGFLAEESAADGSVYYRTTPAGACFLEGCSKIRRCEEDEAKFSRSSIRVKHA